MILSLIEMRTLKPPCFFEGNCLRVDRGSSYLFPAWLLHSATRERNPADFRDVIMGFRVARTLP